MEFLENAIFSNTNYSLLGARLTTYTPEVYTSRASVKLYTAEEFRENYAKFTPWGFQLGDNGTIMSDTPARCTLVDSVFSYVESESKQSHQHTFDTTDLVLHGVAAKGFVVVNYKETLTGAEPILIPFRNFRVSRSSFNIYASYKNEDDYYRTFSLLDVREGGPKRFYAAFPEEYNLSGFQGGITLAGALEIDGHTYIVYLCELGLSTFYASVGEAFLNYLAYNVSFYDIGIKALTGLIETVHPRPKPVYKKEENVERLDRVPHKNIGISHVYTECRLQEYANCGNNMDKVVELFKRCPEAIITYQWVDRVQKSPWFIETRDAQGTDEAYYVACTNLMQECRRDGLKCALELLTHRYFILSQGVANDNLGLILRGGGVDGESIKQSDFWYR